jgi:lauroyl/myristoyl acyltransferase
VSWTKKFLQLGTAAASHVPLPVLIAAGEGLGRVVAARSPKRVSNLVENLRRVRPELSEKELGQLARDGFASYGRYWAETLRLPTLDAEAIDAGFVVDGYEHLLATRAAGFGPIMVLPHLGGWEWAAAWLGRVAQTPVSAVVERLDPPDVFDWFVDLRSSYGISVIPVGDGAMPALTNAVRERHVVCLLGDRDISMTGVSVEFFGAETSLPIGPAILSRRTGAPILPTAVFFDGHQRRCRIGAPIWPVGQGKLRAEALATTVRVTAVLESLIAEAPEQWHVLEPLWPDADTVSGSRIENGLCVVTEENSDQ